MNIPYYPEGPLPSDTITAAQSWKKPAHNITEAMSSISSWFKEDTDFEESFIYKEIHKYGLTDLEAKSQAMRFLIHYVGDSHQPFHAVVRINAEKPGGDGGGNKVNLKKGNQKTRAGARNLHMVWDSVVYKYFEKND